MAEPLSQERFNTISSVSNQCDDPIPETDSSDMDDSQPLANDMSNAYEVTISETSCESDEHSSCDSNHPAENVEFVAETESSQSSDSQPSRSQSEFVADDEIHISATSSESDEDEHDMDHASGIENDSLGLVPNTPAQISLSPPSFRNSETRLSPMYNGSYDENRISESGSSQRSRNQFVMDSEISIPETPSQSDSEPDEANRSQTLGNSQHSNQNLASALSIGLDQLEDNFVSGAVHSNGFNDELRRELISPDIFSADDDNIIPNSLNVAESNAGASYSIISPVIHQANLCNEPHGSQSEENEESVRDNDDFPFIMPGKWETFICSIVIKIT